MTCAFTGYRPEKLPWGTDESDTRCRLLAARMRHVIALLTEHGYDTFLCGMARGCDQLFFDAAAEVRRTAPLTLVAALPCRNQQARWTPAEQARYTAALAQADRVVVLSERYYPGCMQMRNRWLVDHADALLCVWDGQPGGTASTLEYARQKGVPHWNFYRPGIFQAPESPD